MRTSPSTTPPSPLKETANPLKLSEALRLGAMATKQVFGRLGNLEETCAIGAANLGYGENPESQSVFAILSHAKADPCHLCDGGRGMNNMANLIIHMNDDHKVPREQIADYLESKGF